MKSPPDLKRRPIKSLAWLGDALYELKLRKALLLAGDFHPRDLNTMGAKLARAETQAEIFLAMQARLSQEELDVAQRGKNASVRAGGRGIRNTKDYRLASGLEALVAHWHLCGDEGKARETELLDPEIQVRVDALVQQQREQN